MKTLAILMILLFSLACGGGGGGSSQSNSSETYLLIDISGGQDATRFSTTELSSKPDLTSTGNQLYKTTTIVLKKINSGSFLMGSPDSEVGRSITEKQHNVTITEDFYMGVFEITQRQWELVMGNNPSSDPNDLNPAETIGYSIIRGAEPQNPNAVLNHTFLGILRSKSGLNFDLPTEAQWEYTCRAGSTSAFSNNIDIFEVNSNYFAEGLSEIANYNNERKRHTEVGSYQPNPWGIYDMHGNVFELCFDWHTEYTGSDEIDPTGPSTPATGEYQRVFRGGYYEGDATYYRSAYRWYAHPDSPLRYVGFRISLMGTTIANFTSSKDDVAISSPIPSSIEKASAPY